MTEQMESPDTLEGSVDEESDADEDLKARFEDEYDRDDEPETIAAEITCVVASC